MQSDIRQKIEELCTQDPRYSAEGYAFVIEAVDFTVGRLTEKRHVSAAELLDGIRDFAVHEFGAVAENVLKSWGMHREDDAGTIVFLLISVQLLRASENDSEEDFRTGKPIFPHMPQIRKVRRKTDDLPFIV